MINVVNDPLFPDGPEATARRVARAMYGLPSESLTPAPIPINRRMDAVINPNAMFMCSNGHLQYNLTDEEKSDQRSRGIDPPDDVWEGKKCRNCDERLALLTTDPKELQQKLSTQMMIVAQLRESEKAFKATYQEYTQIALYIRGAYDYEMNVQGAVQHSGPLDKAVIHYLKIERGRWRVTARRMWRWLRRITIGQ